MVIGAARIGSLAGQIRIEKDTMSHILASGGSIQPGDSLAEREKAIERDIADCQIIGQRFAQNLRGRGIAGHIDRA